MKNVYTSGNIINTILDHLGQFLIIPNAPTLPTPKKTSSKGTLKT